MPRQLYIALISIIGCIFTFFIPKISAGTVEGTLILPNRNKGPRIAIEKYTGKISGEVAPKPSPVAGVWLTRKGLSVQNSPSLSRANRFDLGRYKKNETPEPSQTFTKTGFIKLRCEIHEHMRAAILVVDSPYVTTTDTNGAFTLKNIPPGTYTLHAQLDKKTKWKVDITVLKKSTTQIPPLKTK